MVSIILSGGTHAHTGTRFQHNTTYGLTKPFQEPRYTFLLRTFQWLRDQTRNTIIKSESKFLLGLLASNSLHALGYGYFAGDFESTLQSGYLLRSSDSLVSIEFWGVMEASRQAEREIHG